MFMTLECTFDGLWVALIQSAYRFLELYAATIVGLSEEYVIGGITLGSRSGYRFLERGVMGNC